VNNSAINSAIYDIICMWNLKKAKITGIEGRVLVTRGWTIRELRRCWPKGTNLQLEDE